MAKNIKEVRDRVKLIGENLSGFGAVFMEKFIKV